MKILKGLFYIVASVFLIFCGFAISSYVNKGNQTNYTVTGIGGTIKNIGELATAEYEYTKIGSIDDPKKIFKMEIPFTTSKMTFSYDGTIKAGINFENVDISVNEILKVINIKIPQAEILSSVLRRDSFKSYDEHHNIFNPITGAEYNEAQAKLQEAAETEAIDKGLLDRATENAKTIISTSISGLYNPEEYKIKFEVVEEESSTDSVADETTTNSEAA